MDTWEAKIGTHHPSCMMSSLNICFLTINLRINVAYISARKPRDVTPLAHLGSKWLACNELCTKTKDRWNRISTHIYFRRVKGTGRCSSFVNCRHDHIHFLQGFCERVNPHSSIMLALIMLQDRAAWSMWAQKNACIDFLHNSTRIDDSLLNCPFKWLPPFHSPQHEGFGWNTEVANISMQWNSVINEPALIMNLWNAVETLVEHRHLVWVFRLDHRP